MTLEAQVKLLRDHLASALAWHLVHARHPDGDYDNLPKTVDCEAWRAALAATAESCAIKGWCSLHQRFDCAATAEPVRPTLAERFEQVDSQVPVTEEEACEILEEAGVDPSKSLARLMRKLDEPDEACPKRADGVHCVHWYDGDRPCCACGDDTHEPEPSPAPRDAHLCKRCHGDGYESCQCAFVETAAPRDAEREALLIGDTCCDGGDDRHEAKCPVARREAEEREALLAFGEKVREVCAAAAVDESEERIRALDLAALLPVKPS